MTVLTDDGDVDPQIYMLQINSASPYQATILIEAELHEGNVFCLHLAFTHQSCDKNGIFIFLKNL